jgi:hypothetical protein
VVVVGRDNVLLGGLFIIDDDDAVAGSYLRGVADVPGVIL